MSRLDKAGGVLGAPRSQIAREGVAPKNGREPLVKTNKYHPSTAKSISATITFPASCDFTVTLSQYLKDIEDILPIGALPPGPARVFGEFLKANDEKLDEMLREFLKMRGRS